MSDSNNLINITGNHQLLSAQLTPQMEKWVADVTGRAVEQLRTLRGSPEEVIREVAASIRRDLLDRMVDAEFMKAIYPGLTLMAPERQKTWIHQMSYALRKLSPEVHLAVPGARDIMSNSALVVTAMAGATMGVAAAFLTNLSPANQLVAALLLSPLGSFIMINGTRWSVNLSPLGNWIKPRHETDSSFLENARNNIRDAIRLWLEGSLSICLLLTGIIPSESPEHDDSIEMPDGLLGALTKLSQVPHNKRLEMVEEVLQEFHNAGYSAELPEKAVMWHEGLRTEYDVLGVLHPGDRCRILQLPVKQGNEVRRKGRVTRVR